MTKEEIWAKIWLIHYDVAIHRGYPVDVAYETAKEKTYNDLNKVLQEQNSLEKKTIAQMLMENDQR